MTNQTPTQPPIPQIERTEHGHRLLVDGHPALLLGGQLHNSTPTDVGLPEVLERVRSLNASVAIGSVSWSLVEAEEGVFDFSSVDTQLDAFREAGLRLILIWFGAFKNAASTYAPRWVRSDPQRFPRAVAEGGKKELFTYAGATPKPVLSVFSESLRDADARAFVAFMTHLRQVDPQHTVVMVQVENEVGLLKDSRDRCPLADQAWGTAVPDALLRVLKNDPSTFASPVTEAWQRGGARLEGTWQEVFGSGWEADEIFMAWHFGAYTEVLAAAGKAVKPLPMFANAWVGPQPGQPEAGDYPSGGPASRVLDIWKAAAPSLDFLAADVYVDDVKTALSSYARADNPLFVPESRIRTGNVFWAIGLGAFGFSAFGVEDSRPGNRFAQAFGVLGGMVDVITQAQAEGRVTGVLLEAGERQEIRCDDLQIVLQGSRSLLQTMLLDAGVQAPPPVVETTSETAHGLPAPADTRAFGLVIRLAQDDYVIVGQDLTVDFAVPGGSVEVDSVELGRFEDSTWVRTRVVNGDERLSIVPHDEVGIARVRLLRLPAGREQA